MLTKQQQKDLEQAVLGFLISKKYYRTASSLVQESQSLKHSENVELSSWPEEGIVPSKIELNIYPGNDPVSLLKKTNETIEGLKVSHNFHIFYREYR